MAYESKQLQNGCLYVRVDIPGVPKERFTVSVKSGMVMVTGDAPAVSHDSGGRFYSGEVAMLSNPIDIPIRQIKIISKNGVIRLIIPPAWFWSCCLWAPSFRMMSFNELDHKESLDTLR